MSSKNQIDKEYIRRINMALDHIDSHLDLELSLASVANIALYSPYHFHRVFKAVLGETLNSYINRRRIEKIASILLHQKEVSITELSLQFGFSSNSSLTRAFKKFYSVSPSQFRKQSPGKFSKICQVESKNGQEHSVFEKYICNSTNHLKWITMNATIEIKEIEDLHFASITHIGINGIAHAFESILKWARPKGYLENLEMKMARIFHDSFKITAPDKVRMSIGMLINEPFKTTAEIHKTQIDKGRYICSHQEITPNDFEQSWSALFIWMNENGYKKAVGNPFEIYQNDFREHPENKCIVDMYIPIE